jgi:hypothetical protein
MTNGKIVHKFLTVGYGKDGEYRKKRVFKNEKVYA